MPRKVKIFNWLAIHDKLLAQDNMKKRGWNVSQSCTLCGELEETSNRVFVSDPYSKQTWTLIATRMENSQESDILEELWSPKTMILEEKRAKVANSSLTAIITCSI